LCPFPDYYTHTGQLGPTDFHYFLTRLNEAGPSPAWVSLDGFSLSFAIFPGSSLLSVDPCPQFRACFHFPPRRFLTPTFPFFPGFRSSFFSSFCYSPLFVSTGKLPLFFPTYTVPTFSLWSYVSPSLSGRFSFFRCVLIFSIACPCLFPFRPIEDVLWFDHFPTILPMACWWKILGRRTANSLLFKCKAVSPFSAIPLFQAPVGPFAPFLGPRPFDGRLRG